MRVSGSSPLTRGKPPSPSSPVLAAGLIPAHAGKTRFRRRQTRSPRAHPRSRGENTNFGKIAVCCPGSSPLTRGKQGWVGSGSLMTGLIPAHAGKTMSGVVSFCQVGAHPRSRGETHRRRGRPPSLQAHPRSRGENCAHFVGDGDGGGSSPLTRGKREHENRRTAKRGLIPAHAGKTSDCLVAAPTL